uniref:Peptidase_M13 domain-containing protein n=1 Tax=Globodera pallida TaxID=36090 RepID=A0A183CN67_GLOPA
MLEDIELFNSANTWDALLTIGPADRQQFSESPAIVNAWYQPQLNSITFPLALLQPPFFNPGWPDSINYGAIGVVIGHELVHGFDDEGIQWGAVGGLRDWMGAASVGAFRKMADCVVDEFGAFCPLNGTELSPTCIDGSATQGENIADSGGIEAAFRAFRNSLSFYGPNPRLPGGLAGQFSDDQLFFLSFANIWCQRPMDVDEGEEFAQLLLDTHSPPKFRVLGTLRNFPAFRTAFNCPLGKRYAPPETEHCNVWVDEIKAVNGVAPQIAAPPAINVPEWKQSNDGFFTTTANLLSASMDNKKTLPKEQSKEFFRKCLDDTTNWRHLTNGSRVVLKHMAKFKSRTRIHFPLMDAAEGKQIAYNWPDPTAMGNALAYLSSNYGSDTLLSTSVDTNWGDDPQGNQPYSLYIDQGALALPQKYYSDPVWTRINQSYVEEVANLLGRYVRASGKQVNETEVRKVAEQIGHFEYTFANHLMTEEERRTNFSRMFNPMKFMEVAQSLSWVDLPIYMQEMLFTAATPEVFERLFQERYSVVVMEPEMLKKTSNAFKHDNPFGFAPAQLFNYLSFRLLLSLSPYFESDSPYSSKVFRNVPEIYVRPPTGRPRWEEPIFDMNEFFGDDQSKTINSNSKTNQFMTLIGCTLSSLEMLPHQTSRLYLDFVLPRERDRLYLRKTVANLVENVVVGFDSMLDQLEWMGKASKKSASEKVSNMVRNIGFPDWIADDQQLNAYSKQFPLIAEDNLIETKFGISNFFLKKALEPLAWKGHTNRTNFNGLPMTVNAWYQPQLNSITFPLAILTPPFFHPNSPTALNYGIFGAIVGHELTHAFDSTGTQFDAFGKLRQWLDPKSMAAFDAMVQCVIYQYGRFCPINEKNGTANCVDGISSRGENVADNGGIRAAYRAYKNAMDYRGADFALPGPLLSQYDHEQLFFLSFAQTWCQPSDAKTHQRLLFDVHPAPEFRLLGSLQNFPAFQNAFHCPKDSLYAPIDHCDVWVSDVKLDNGEHFPPPPSLNIPSREKELSQKFREASEYFEKSVDIGQDPCNNFYEYACNSFEGVGHFDRISIQNLITLTNALKGYRHEQIEPIQKAKLAFQKCNLMMNNYQEALKKADLPREKFFLFQKKSRFDFPMFAGQKLGWPTRDELSTALGALSGSILVDTLISFYVDTNWEDPNSEEMMANYMGVEYAWKDLKAAVQEVIGIERTLANHFLANADSRLNDMGSRFNVFSVSEAQRQFPFLNWSLFLRELAENAPQTVKEKMRQPNFRFAIVEPSLLAKLGNELGPGNSYNITANQLLNYFYFRLILSNSAFMPQGELSKNGTINVPITENWTKRALKFGGHIIKPVSSKDYFFYRPSVGRPRRMEIFAKEKMRKVNAEIFYSEFVCAEYTLAMMDLVSGRLWLDHALPSREMRMNVKNGAKKLVNSILLSFRSMVQQISWMSPRAKSSAHNKLDKIVANIGWPQIMVNNSELEQYYKPLVFTDNENFVNIWEKGMKFAYTRQWQHLLKRHGTDRTEFNEQIILVNAWYQPELNSITVPASILSQPFFDREWPDFINYGTIGAVLGHELSHGFDNLGVQWDSDGSAIKWLDARSQLAFDRMAKCLVDEYSQLCPFPRDGRIQPACIDGNKTQGENIADNGGLHAAFRAYRSALEVDGPSKALPGDLIGRFSPDQLFFMSFAQPWCEEPNEFETFLQLMDDTHSPAKFRVLGSLRNFPAFRDSFNCPLNSKYAPEKHCDVWVSSVTEKPIAAPPANLLNVPTAQMARADDEEFAAYKSAVQYFKNSMNLASDPCNNFYEYACANYRGPTGFAVKQNDNYKRIATAIEQMEPKPDSALEKLKQFFTACTSTLPQLDALILDGAVLRARLDRFIAFTNMDFPLFSVRSSFDMPNGDTLARALAWLSAREGVDTLVTPFVDVELAPSEEGQKGPQNYRLFLDQNTLAFRKSYYQPGTWELIREKYATNAKTLLRRVGHVLGKATDEKVLEEAVQGLLELELRLAREFSTDEEKRMDVGRWAHTLETLDNANRVVPLLDWNTYVKQLTKLSGVNLGDPKKKQFAYFIEGNMM